MTRIILSMRLGQSLTVFPTEAYVIEVHIAIEQHSRRVRGPHLIKLAD